MKNLHRNGIILFLAICFSALSFIGAADAQTKNSKKATPTPAKKTSPAKDAKKDAKTNAKTNAKKDAKESPKSKSAQAAKTNSKSAPKPSKTPAKSKSDMMTQKEKSNSKSKAENQKSKTANNLKSKSESDRKSKKENTSSSKKENVSKPIPKIEPKSTSGEQLIVVATDSRIRQQPKANAPQVSLVKIGKLLPVFEKNGAWQRVEYENGKSGWILNSMTRDYENDNRDVIYQEIADKYLKNKSLDFATAAEVSDFLRTAQALVKKDATKAEMGFKRLRILAAAMKAVPSGKGDVFPYKSFLQAHEKEVVYSEPSGMWLVRSDVFWELHGRYMQSAIAEDIAWEAARNDIPGECEGYINCQLYVLRAMEGEYLNFYPNGKYSRQALEAVTVNLGVMVADMKDKTIFTPLADISDRAEFNRFLTELRTIISKVSDADKAKPLQHINQLGEGYK
ncbi:MAG: hypothetical protein LH614_01045 [Pyrinomonadaceae bacterium]|nr:hypothetical protein [Pyrinomonadaceae bacterium]